VRVMRTIIGTAGGKKSLKAIPHQGGEGVRGYGVRVR